MIRLSCCLIISWLMLQLLTACSSFSINKPEVHISGVAVKELSFKNIVLDVQLQLDNPNAYGFNIEGVDYLLRINGQQMIAGEHRQMIVVEAHSSQVIAVPLKIKFSEMRDALARTKGLSKIGYEVETKTYIKLNALGTIAIPSVHDGAWDLAEILRFPL